MKLDVTFENYALLAFEQRECDKKASAFQPSNAVDNSTIYQVPDSMGETETAPG